MMSEWKPGQSYHEAMLWIMDQTLFKTKGNKAKAAAMLKVSVRKIRYWVAKYPELERYRGKTLADLYPDI